MALAPYIEVAEPSFKTVNDSISLAFKPATAELIKVNASPEDRSSEETFDTSSIIIPSITQSGFELP
ncbi:hypothetical protein D3C73_504240 [compost metagenome]